MQRIEKIRIQSFKCFDDLSLRLGQLTLLTGLNGGGKSTVIQSILLVSQGLRNGSDGEYYPLNGRLVSLGTVGDIVGSNRDKFPNFSFSCAGGKVDWDFYPQDSDRFLLLENYDSQNTDSTGIVRCLENLEFIGASRGVERRTYPATDTKLSTFASVGTDGIFAPQCWYDQADSEIPERKRHQGEQSPVFRRQLNAWLSSLFPGAEANVQFFREAQQFGLQFRLSDTGQWVHPSNIGYGLSYAFPVIVALLSALPGQLVIVDSPEAHLHPYAQSQMGRFLAKFAHAGVQVIVETHSDHLLNGVRLAVKEGMVSSEEMALHFFSHPSENEHGVASLNMDKHGSIDYWPTGFFDQGERDLFKLADLD